MSVPSPLSRKSVYNVPSIKKWSSCYDMQKRKFKSGIREYFEIQILWVDMRILRLQKILQQDQTFVK